MRVLVIDNYDSFVYNLVQYVGELGGEPAVLRNSATLAEARELRPQRIIISPGPGRPEESGLSLDAIREFGQRVPTLGVCLGHQAIGLIFGARVVHAPRLMHGKSSTINHDGKSIFRGVRNPLKATRYHSLIVTEVREPLAVTAKTPEGEVMGLRHRRYPVEGVQFHPESILTEDGKRMVRNFLEGGAGRL